MGLLIADRVPGRGEFGTNALAAFRNACIQSIGVDPDHAVFYRLLADHADHLVDSYHQIPLDVDVAEADYGHFLKLVATATEATDKTPELQIEAANAIAAADFF